jgi:hypothetical protein
VRGRVVGPRTHLADWPALDKPSQLSPVTHSTASRGLVSNDARAVWLDDLEAAAPRPGTIVSQPCWFNEFGLGKP